MTAGPGTADAGPAPDDGDAEAERHRLTALEGLAALSLDALSSVAYGPEAIVIVLITAGVAGLNYVLPVTIAIVVLLAVLVVSYRQVIEAFPTGGGAYAVARRHLGTMPALVAAGSLVVDYILNAAVGVSAGVEALVAAFPSLYGARVVLCLIVLAAITAANLWGAAESARLFILPTIIFIVAIYAVIFGAIVRAHPVVAPPHHLASATQSIGVLLILSAFANGCSALTGVEAIANAVPSFRKPRARRAQHTEMWLGILLGTMLIGMSIGIHRFHTVPTQTQTVLAELTAISFGHHVLFYIVQMVTTVLLALAANTSFGGLPVLASLLASDNFLPHLFFLKADRQVHRYGIGVLAVAAAILLVVSRGDTQDLVPLFAIGVFVGFTLSQVGMVRHWHEQGGPGWLRRAIINGVGAAFTTVALAIELFSKFLEGAWIVVIIIPLLVLMFTRVRRTYWKIGILLGLGQTPRHPHKVRSLVVVPVVGLSRLTEAGMSAALSLGDDVRAVTVNFADGDDPRAADMRRRWQDWHPDVPLVTLTSEHRALGPPIVAYLRDLEREDPDRRVVALIPEVQPARPWLRVFFNQRGLVLDRAIRKGTESVVICRLGFRLTELAAGPSVARGAGTATEGQDPSAGRGHEPGIRPGRTP
jgi:amino acid transporter